MITGHRVSVGHYKKRSDDTLWAIQCEAGRPVCAVQLRDDQLDTAPPLQDFSAAVEASGWKLDAFDRIGGECFRVADPIDRFVVKPVETDGADSFSVAINSEWVDRVRSRPRMVTPQARRTDAT